jgi:riboflavin transporter FmnP
VCLRVCLIVAVAASEIHITLLNFVYMLPLGIAVGTPRPAADHCGFVRSLLQL